MKSSSEIQFINTKVLIPQIFVRCIVPSVHTNPTPTHPNTDIIAKQ